MFRLQKFLQHIFRKSSSLKVFYYIVQPKRHPIERAFWLMCCCCAGFGSFWLSLSTWNRYQKNPTVISLERHSLDWNTTLPAFSLCPKQRVDHAVVRKQAQSVYPDNIEQGIKFFNALANWTYPNLGDMPLDEHFEPSRYQQMIMDIKFNFSHSLPEGTMLKNITSLSPSMTELGICYTLNSQIPYYLDPRYWQSGSWRLREPVPLIHGNPLDVAELSAQVNEIKVKINVFLHEVEETIDGSANYMYPVDLQEAMYIDINIISSFSTEAAKSLTVFQRKCRFMEESNLETSPVYSYRLCRTECRMHLSLRLCGCIPYFYRNSGKYKICGPSGMNCLNKHKDQLLKLRKGNKKETCNCLPNCNSIGIMTNRILQAPWKADTVFRLGLESYPRYRLKRDVVFSFGDLLAQMGGAAGLCLGCSVLSLFEVFYLFTIRLFFYIRNKGELK